MRDITVPLQLVGILADGAFHSGERLGEKFGMSRAGINKHIQVIRSWGLEVFTHLGKGYHLPSPIQLLNEQVILGYLPEGRVKVLSIVDSTNQYLLDSITELHSGDACIAEYQKAGRGRRGRHWVSPFGTNLYLSMFWRLACGPVAAVGLSLVVGVVMAEVLRDFGAEGVRVKWPNDVYLNDKKLAGVLVEVMGNIGDVAQLVIGIGINLTMRESQANMIDQDWINLQEVGVIVDRNKLAAELLSELRSAVTQFENKGLAPFISRWCKLDNYLDRPIKLLIGSKEIFGIARGINQQGALLVDQDGKRKLFIDGEISLRSA